PRTQAQIPKPNREVATAAKGSGGSQTGTLCRWEGLTSAATSAAIATPKKIPRARFGCRRQATPHKARNRTRPLICSHAAITEESSRWQHPRRLANPTNARAGPTRHRFCEPATVANGYRGLSKPPAQTPSDERIGVYAPRASARKTALRQTTARTTKQKRRQGSRKA